MSSSSVAAETLCSCSTGRVHRRGTEIYWTKECETRCNGKELTFKVKIGPTNVNSKVIVGRN